MYLFHSGNFKGGRTASRALLANAIKDYCALSDIRGVDAEELVKQIVTSENGKPSIPGFAHFSVSHSGQYWAVLFDSEPCGLDIQLGKDLDYMAIAEKYYSEKELERVKMFGYDEFFHIWTRREAFVKAIGSTVFSPTPELLFGHYDCNIEVEHEGVIWQVRDIEMPVKIFASVCTKRFEQVKPYAMEFADRFVRE